MMHTFFEEALSLPCPPTAPNILVHSGLPGNSRGCGPEQVPLCKNPTTKLLLERVIKDFLAPLVSAPPRIVVVKFAGHGIRDRDNMYLVPANAKLNEHTDLKDKCLSHHQLFGLLKTELENKIAVKDVLYLVILDMCQNLPKWLQPQHHGHDEAVHSEVVEPDGRSRPKRWALCTSTANGTKAPDGSAEHSPFLQELMSTECGFLQQNVSIKLALERARSRLLAAGGQEPFFIFSADLGDICLHGPIRHIPGRYDVFICHRGGTEDCEIADALHNELSKMPVEVEGMDSRNIEVFFEPSLGNILLKDQIADALCCSTVIILLVSQTTFDGICDLQPDSPGDEALVRMLAQYEMALEMHEQRRDVTILPLLIGNKVTDGQCFYQHINSEDKGQMSKYWPVHSESQNIRVNSIVRCALAGLRRDFNVSQKLDNKKLRIGVPSILQSSDGKLSKAGRTIQQTISACSSTNNFISHMFSGTTKDALRNACTRIQGLVSSTQMEEPKSKHKHNTGQEREFECASSDSNLGQAGASRGSRSADGRGRIFDVYISHTWDKDDEGRDNHQRAKRLNGSLQRLGIRTWFDNEQMHGDTLQRMAEGIERSLVILICVSRRYMEKVAQVEDNNCKFEFNYAVNKRTTLNLLSVVMEKSMQKTKEWKGSLGMTMGVHLYHKLMSDVDAEFDDAVNGIAAAIRKKIEPQTVLANELQGVAGRMSSRSPSPTPSDMSDRATMLGSPPPLEQEIVAMHIDRNVKLFRGDMKEFMQSFLCSGDQSPPRKWKMCELLLVAFMRDKVAPLCDSVIADNLEVWQGWCEDPDENLIDAFHKLMQSLKPPIFEELSYDFAKEIGKPNHISIFVIDWMVQHSKWALQQGKRDEWVEKIMLQWFEPENTDPSNCLLERAENFLQKGVKGTSWGAKILWKVIQTNSYVVFFRMGALSSLLVREHCALEKRRYVHKMTESDCTSQYAPLLSISLLVSSSQWHLSLVDGKEFSAAHMSEIAWRLQRVAFLPSELLEENEHSISNVDRVKCEPLYNLEKRDNTDPDKSSMPAARAEDEGGEVGEDRMETDGEGTSSRAAPMPALMQPFLSPLSVLAKAAMSVSISDTPGHVDLLRVQSASSGCAEESGDSSSLGIGPPTFPRPPD